MSIDKESILKMLVVWTLTGIASGTVGWVCSDAFSPHKAIMKDIDHDGDMDVIIIPKAGDRFETVFRNEDMSLEKISSVRQLAE